VDPKEEEKAARTKICSAASKELVLELKNKAKVNSTYNDLNSNMIKCTKHILSLNIKKTLYLHLCVVGVDILLLEPKLKLRSPTVRAQCTTSESATRRVGNIITSLYEHGLEALKCQI